MRLSDKFPLLYILSLMMVFLVVCAVYCPFLVLKILFVALVPLPAWSIYDVATER